MDLDTMRTLVRNIDRVPDDDALLTTEQVDQGIVGAVKRHSVRRPLKTWAAVSCSGDPVPLSSVVPGWAESWSVRELYRRGLRLDQNLWHESVGQGLDPTLWCAAPGEYQMLYARPHELHEDGTTIDQSDFDAVGHLAASLVLRQMANLYAQQKNSTITADAVDYARLASEYFMRARDEALVYTEHLASQPQETSARVDWDRRTWSGRGRMFGNNMRSGL